MSAEGISRGNEEKSYTHGMRKRKVYKISPHACAQGHPCSFEMTLKKIFIPYPAVALPCLFYQIFYPYVQHKRWYRQ